MDNIISETTETGGKVFVPLDAVIENDTTVGDIIREKVKAEGERLGKSKVRLQQQFDIEKQAYLVEWTWAD